MSERLEYVVEIGMGRLRRRGCGVEGVGMVGREFLEEGFDWEGVFSLME